MDVFDPQKVLNNNKLGNHSVQAVVQTASGDKTFFVKLKQGQFIWWQPVCFAIAKYQDSTKKTIQITSKTIFEKINLTPYFNDKVTNIFKQQYLSPRPKSPTMQLPVQGIGNWCYPLINAAINDFGTRQIAKNNDQITTPENVPFTTPADSLLNNIMFTSQWDNYPKEKTIALSGAATQLHLLMAGSTNAMQSRFVNGVIIVQYKDASSDTLQLINPQNWWPIEQDYYTDGVAFTTDAAMPLRLYLKEGKFAYGLKKYTSIKGFSNQAIDGGAATVLVMPLNGNKQLKSVTLQTIANDVVIGLMSITLQRN